MNMNPISDYFRSGYENVTTYISTEIKETNTGFIRPAIAQAKLYTPVVIEFSKKLLALTWKIVKIAVFIIISFILYQTNTIFMLLGAATAIVFPEHMRKALNTIYSIWQSYSWKTQLAIGVVFTLTSPLYWPSYFVIAAPFFGAKICLDLQDRASTIQTQTQTPPPQDNGARIVEVGSS